MLFSSILKLRDDLADCASRNNILSTLSTGVDRYQHDASGQIDEILLDYDSADAYLKITNTVTGEYEGIDVVDLPDYLNQVVPGTSITIGDYLQTYSASGDLYSMLGSITAKYSYSNRLSLTNLNQIIDGIGASGSIGYDVKELKNHLLSVVNDEGFISVKVWLTTIKAWFQYCDDEASNQSPSLDETQPYALGGLYSIILNAVTSTLASLFTLMSSCFRGILAVVGAIFSVLFKAISEGVNISASIDTEAPNLFAKGVAKSFEIDVSMSSNLLWSTILNSLSGYEIKFLQMDSIGMFVWRSDVNDHTLRVNCYIQPSASPESLVSTVNSAISEGSLSWMTNSLNEDLGIQRNDRGWGSLIHWDNLMSDDEENLASADVIYYCACVCASEFQRQLKDGPRRATNSAGISTSNYFRYGLISQCTSDSDKAVALPLYGARLVSNLIHNRSLYDGISTNSLVDAVNKWAGYLFSQKDSYVPSLIHKISSGFDPCTVQANPLFCYGVSAEDGVGFKTEYSYSGSTVQVSSYSYVNNPTAKSYFIAANCLPQNFAVTFQAVTSGEWFTLLLISSAATIAAAFVYTKVARAIRVKKIKKDAIRTNRIEQAKQAWADDPSNMSKLNAYAAEVDKYNRMGRILGWGTYDAKNGWIDSSFTGSSEPKTSPIISSVGATLGTAVGSVANSIIDDVLPSVNGKASQDSVTSGFNSLDQLVRGRATSSEVASVTNDVQHYLINTIMPDIQQYIDSHVVTLLQSIKDLIKG